MNWLNVTARVSSKFLHFESILPPISRICQIYLILPKGKLQDILHIIGQIGKTWGIDQTYYNHSDIQPNFAQTYYPLLQDFGPLHVKYFYSVIFASK